MSGILKQINRSNGGLPKLPVAGPVMLTEMGVEGDRQRNRFVHGGPMKAALMIASEVIDSLAGRFPVYAGALGENLTVAGLDPHAWRTGQRYRVGEAVIELTRLRVPCANLYVYGMSIARELYDSQCEAADVTSPHWAHGGFYARVLRAGMIMPGASVDLESDLA